MMLAAAALFAFPPAQTFDGTARTPAKVAFTQEVGGDEVDLFILRPRLRPVRVFRGGRQPQWSPSGRYLAFYAKDGIWAYDERQGTSKRLVPLEETPFYRSFDWSPDSRFILYEKATPVYGLYAYDLAKRESRRLLTTQIYTRRQWTGFERGEGAEPADIVLLDANLRLVMRVTRDTWYQQAFWLPDDKVLLQRAGDEPADGAGHPTHFFVRDLAGGKRKSLKLPWDVEGYWTAISPDGRRLAATADGHGQILYLVDLSTGQSKIVDRNVYPSQLAWSRDGRFVFFEKLGSNPKDVMADTEQVFRLDTRTGKAAQITHQPDSYASFQYDNTRGTVMFEDHGTVDQIDGQGVVPLGECDSGAGDFTAWWPSRRR